MRPNPPALQRAPWNDVLFWCVATAALFFGLGGTSLWAAESRWAEVTREFFLSGRFFHPTINGASYYDKPLLTYWLIAALRFATGSLNELTIRIPSACSGLVVLWSTRHLARRLYSERVATLAGWILLSSYSFVLWSRTGMADMENMAFITLGIAWYWTRRDRPTFSTYLVFYLILFVGSQMKGLTAFVVPVLAVAPDLLLCGRWRHLLSRAHLLGFAVGLGVYFAPFLASAAFHDGNGLTLALRENFQRYFSPFDHEGSIFTYVVSLPLIFLPWTPLLLIAIAAALRSARWRAWRWEVRWLALAAILIFGFYTASGSRRSYYILPMLPFCALFVAIFLATPGREAWKRVGLGLMASLALVVCCAELIGGLAWPLLERWGVLEPLPAGLALSGIIVGALGLVLWWPGRRSAGRPSREVLFDRLAMRISLTTMIVLMGFFCCQNLIFERFRTRRSFALELAATGHSAREIAFYHSAKAGVIFYLDRSGWHPVITVAQDAHRFLAECGDRALIVLRRRDFDRLHALLPAGVLGVEVLAEGPRGWPPRVDGKELVAWAPLGGARRTRAGGAKGPRSSCQLQHALLQ